MTKILHDELYNIIIIYIENEIAKSWHTKFGPTKQDICDDAPWILHGEICKFGTLQAS